jgi:hypothetical protein
LSVLYGCETWSLTLKEEHRLRVLRRIFGPKREEVTGECRKLCKLYNVLLTKDCSGNKFEKNGMDGACNTYGGEERRTQGFDEET